ncbi:hypothetical protein L2E82_22784 [Cichorium intybus]|uniref:Uncharacterized protein n=1 Tax=Cichorium intybus TaxID=13427 RepID=A0ACB9DZ39_CICIN|nr:hypothetical protein L2E82_22784 [Cichorium intybus]
MELKQELGTIVGRGDFQAIKELCPGAGRSAPRITAGCAQAQCAGYLAQTLVWDKMVVVHAKARNNRDLNAASIQISRESDKDKNGAIRLLPELCSSYRLLNVPTG